MISVVWGDVRNYEDSGGHRAAFQAYAVIVSFAVAMLMFHNKGNWEERRFILTYSSRWGS